MTAPASKTAAIGVFLQFIQPFPRLEMIFQILPLSSPKTNGKGKINGNVPVENARRPEPIYSSRSSVKGSIDSARCAGIQVANKPSSAIARTTPVNTSGSLGVA